MEDIEFQMISNYNLLNNDCLAKIVWKEVTGNEFLNKNRNSWSFWRIILNNSGHYTVF